MPDADASLLYVTLPQGHLHHCLYGPIGKPTSRVWTHTTETRLSCSWFTRDNDFTLTPSIQPLELECPETDWRLNPNSQASAPPNTPFQLFIPNPARCRLFSYLRLGSHITGTKQHAYRQRHLSLSRCSSLPPHPSKPLPTQRAYFNRRHCLASKYHRALYLAKLPACLRECACL